MADAENAKDAVKDILDNRREFNVQVPGGEALTLFISNPSGEDIRKAEWQYSKVFNQAIVDGILTQAQMLELLKKKEILTEEYTQRLETVRISIGAELFKLEHLMGNATEEEKELVALEVARLRDELFQLNQRINGPMSNTCENMAEDARIDFLTSRIIEKKDKSKLWKDYDSYRNEDNTPMAVQARFEVMLWLQGLDSNFLANTPEQSVLRTIAHARLERATAVQDKAAEVEVEEEVALPEEPIADPASKKRGRPKGSAGKKAK